MEVENSAMPRTCPSKSTASKMAFYKSKGKCHRPGPVGRNPYLNFLREFRKRNCGLSAVETVRRGAKEWKSLPKEKKLQYIEAAFYAPKRRRQHATNPADATCCPKVLCPNQIAKRKKARSKKKNACAPKKKKKNACAPKKKKKRSKSKKNKCGKSKKSRKAKRVKKGGCKKRKPKRKGCKC